MVLENGRQVSSPAFYVIRNSSVLRNPAPWLLPPFKMNVQAWTRECVHVNR